MTSPPTQRALVPDNEPRCYELTGDLTLPDALLAESSNALHHTCRFDVGHIFLFRTQLINETKDNIPPPPTNRLKMMRPETERTGHQLHPVRQPGPPPCLICVCAPRIRPANSMG